MAIFQTLSLASSVLKVGLNIFSLFKSRKPDIVIPDTIWKLREYVDGFLPSVGNDKNPLIALYLYEKVKLEAGITKPEDYVELNLGFELRVPYLQTLISNYEKQLYQKQTPTSMKLLALELDIKEMLSKINTKTIEERIKDTYPPRKAYLDSLYEKYIKNLFIDDIILIMENNVENIQDKNIKKYVKKAVELYKWIKPLIYDYRQDLIAFRLTFLITIKLDLIAAIWNEIISQIETLKQQTGITEKPINLDIIPAKPQIQEKLPAVDISKVNIMAQSLQQPISEPKEVIKQVIENITPQITQQSEQNKTETNKTSFEFSYTFALFAFIFLFFIFLIIRR